MSFNVTTSASTAVTTVTAVSSPDEQSTSLDSYATENSLSLTTGADESDVVMVLGGEATAIGENTLAYGDIDVTIDGSGPATSAYGSATFIAAAESPIDSGAFATASSFGYLTGTDFLLVITGSTQIIHQEADESLAVAISETTFYGVDLGVAATGGSGIDDSILAPADEALPGSDDPAAIDPATEVPATEYPTTQDPGTNDEDVLHDFLLDIDGNLAVLDVDAEVLGSDTFLQVEAGVLTLEDTLSTIAVEVIAAAG